MHLSLLLSEFMNNINSHMTGNYLFWWEPVVVNNNGNEELHKHV